MNAADALAEWIDDVEAQGVRVTQIRLRVEELAALYHALMDLYGRLPVGDRRWLTFMGVPVRMRSGVME